MKSACICVSSGTRNVDECRRVCWRDHYTSAFYSRATRGTCIQLYFLYFTKMALCCHQPYMLQDTDDDEKTAAEAIVQDPEAVQAIAVAGGLDEATFRAEIDEFREEMGARFDEVEARMSSYSDAILKGQGRLGTRMDQRFDELSAEVRVLRFEQPRTQPITFHLPLAITVAAP